MRQNGINQTTSGLKPGDYLLLFRKYGIFFILLAMIVTMATISPTFRTSANAINVLVQISINGIIAIGMTFVIISGGIDLSVGSMIAMASVTCGAILRSAPAGQTDSPLYVALAVGASLILCGLLGAFNGFFIARFNLYPFVVTLASMMIGRGIAYIISSGQSFVLQSPMFKELGQGRLFDNIPVMVLVFMAVALIGYALLAHTKFGRYVYAIGGNSKAALASGVNIFSIKILTYAMIGVFTGIAGVILSSRVNAGQPSIGVGYEQDAIAACVIGGTSLTGGIGTIQGTLIGILIIGIINNGMNLLGVSSYYQQVVKGSIILGAVLLDLIVTQKRTS